MGTESTKHEIELAIARIRHGRPKRISKERPLSIAAVAEEAGVSNSTIHNRYPQLAEQIRRLCHNFKANQRSSAGSGPIMLQQQLAEAKKALQQKEEDVRKLAMINLRLSQEIKELQTELARFRVVKLVKNL